MTLKNKVEKISKKNKPILYIKHNVSLSTSVGCFVSNVLRIILHPFNDELTPVSRMNNSLKSEELQGINLGPYVC